MNAADDEVRLPWCGTSSTSARRSSWRAASRSSSSPVLLNTLRPQTVLVQSGYRNRFGHPAPAVLARYAERGARVVDSPRCGAMRWHSGRPDVVRCQRDEARRYWHHEPMPPIGGR